MIKLKRPLEADALKKATQKYLQRRRVSAAGYAPRSKDIDKAWKAFGNTKARKEVARALDAYTHTKCAYCEQIAAKDIEHFYPKADFPTRMFLWTNFLRGCKNCNNAKRDQFPLGGSGAAVLIDPCSEDPLDFFVWDFLTGKMGEHPTEPFRSRATTTRDLLNLDQDPLADERLEKLEDVTYLLARVVNEDPILDKTRTRLERHLRPKRPWLGIVRQLFRRPGPYAPLVTRAVNKLPEIKTWISMWL